MIVKKSALFFFAVAFILTGCAGNTTLYAPPGDQIAVKELYTANTSIQKIQQNIARLGWLKQTGPGLTFSGKAPDPSQYIDCGQILRQEAGRQKPYLPYASPRSKFMGDNSVNELKTTLDVIVKIASAGGGAASVKTEYTLNRELIERRTMFGVESRPQESNQPIKFDTLTLGQGQDGVICRSKFTLEQSLLR